MFPKCGMLWFACEVDFLDKGNIRLENNASNLFNICFRKGQRKIDLQRDGCLSVELQGDEPGFFILTDKKFC